MANNNSFPLSTNNLLEPVTSSTVDYSEDWAGFQRRCKKNLFQLYSLKASQPFGSIPTSVLL